MLKTKKINQKTGNKAKDWRKNIDVSLEEKKRIKTLQAKLDEKEIKSTKPSNFYTYDVSKTDLPKGFIKRSSAEEDEEKRKALETKGYSKLLKRKTVSLKQSEKTISTDLKKDKSEMEIQDIWDSKKTGMSKKPEIVLPRISLPHPGLSYNPSVDDTKNLISTIANKHKGVLVEKKITKELEDRLSLPLKEEKNTFNNDEDSSSSEEEQSEEEKINKDTSLSTAKTRTEINKKRKARLNKLKNEKEKISKQNKVEIFEIKSSKKFEKVQQENLKKLEEKKKQEIEIKNKNDQMLRLGVNFDEELDFNLPSGKPLRSINKDDYARETFNGILKSGMIGEFSKEYKRRDIHNKKKNKFVVREKKKVGEYDVDADNKDLNIYE